MLPPEDGATTADKCSNVSAWKMTLIYKFMLQIKTWMYSFLIRDTNVDYNIYLHTLVRCTNKEFKNKTSENNNNEVLDNVFVYNHTNTQV